MPEEKGLATTQPAGALVRPSFIKAGDVTGTENIGADDIRLPRLAIAQGLSTQLIPDDSSYIKGLTLFDLFNDLTGEIYGRGPIEFIPIRREARYIEFNPDERGVPLDLDVPPNDPRTKWTTGQDGERVPPRATRFVEFIILLLRDPAIGPEPIVLSIKETNKFQRKAAEKLTGYIILPRPPKPIYSGLYTVSSKSEKNDEGTFGVYVINKVRSLDSPTQSDEDWAISEKLYRAAEGFYTSMAGKTITVQREPGDDFDTAELDKNDGGM